MSTNPLNSTHVLELSNLKTNEREGVDREKSSRNTRNKLREIQLTSMEVFLRLQVYIFIFIHLYLNLIEKYFHAAKVPEYLLFF